MIKGRRVGTFTTGVVLVILGIIFLLRTFIPNINIAQMISLWPIILIILGCEVIVAYIINKEEKIQYDFAGIILVIILSFFAMGMGGVDFLMQHAHTYINF